MARSRRMRKRSLGNGTGPATVVGFALLILVVGVYVWFQWNQSKRVGADPYRLCIDEKPGEYLAILVDTTDPLSPTQLRMSRQIIEGKIASAVVGTHISFFLVTPNAELRDQSFFSVCKPAAGEDANRLYENPQLVEENYKIEFVQPIGKALDGLLHVTMADSSPIIESINSLASRIPGFIKSKKPRELLILSDLVQHSDSLSFFRGDSWITFEGSGGADSIGGVFDGAVVSLVRVPRKVDSIEIVDDFWVKYFDRSGFVRISVDQIADTGAF